MNDDDLPIEFPNNVLVRSFGKCSHWGQLLFDEKSEQVECKECGAKITAQEALKRLLAAEGRFQRNWARDKLVREELARRSRCKCRHCGRMTDINFNVTDTSVTDLVHERSRR